MEVEGLGPHEAGSTLLRNHMDAAPLPVEEDRLQESGLVEPQQMDEEVMPPEKDRQDFHETVQEEVEEWLREMGEVKGE